MMENNFVDEVKQLMNNGAQIDWQSMKGIGYREIAAYLNGDMNLEVAVDEMKKATRHFAKRQFTWYKKMPYIKWYDADKLSYENLLTTVIKDCRNFFSDVE